MSPLEERLGELRARVRKLLWVNGLCWLTAVVLGATLAVGWVDWLLHLDDAGVRLILSLGILGTTAYFAYQRLIAPLRVPLTDHDLALRIEERFPTFRDSLASTIQFLKEQRDPRLGAPELQQRVIDKTIKKARQIDFEDVVQTQPVQRIAWTAFLVCCTTALVVGFNQVEAATALKRLVFPFGAHPWPKKTLLQFVDSDFSVLTPDPKDPIRIARGDTLELTTINLNNQGRMPADIRLELRHPDGTITRETMQRTTIRNGTDQQSREAGFASLVVKSPFDFRAVGGDDLTMEWFPMEVVPPPIAESLQVRLIPPKYTRRPPVKLSTGVGHIEAIVGTKVEIQGISNKPLSSAALKVKDKDHHPIKIGADGKTLSASFTILEAGVYSYWLDLRDQQNFGNSDAPRYEIRAIQDTPPDVYIDRPALDIQVTPLADVPIMVISKDDLGLRRVELEYLIHDPAAADAPQLQSIPLASLPDRPKRQSHDYRWELEPLKLTPGMRIQIQGAATDDYDLGPEHVGRSLPRTLLVVSLEQKNQEIAAKQVELLRDLERAQKLQEDLQTQTAELRTQLEKTGTLRPQDIDQLQRIEGQQRQVAANLNAPQDGIIAKSKTALSELDQNKLENPDTRRRLERIGSELQQLADSHLAEIEQQLTQARKRVTGDLDPNQGNSAKAIENPDATPSPSTPTLVPKESTPVKSSTGEMNTSDGKPGTVPQTTTEAGNPDAVRPKSVPNGDQPNLDSKSPSTPADTDPTAVTDRGSGEKSKSQPDQLKPQKRSLKSPAVGATATEIALHEAQQHQEMVSESLEELLRDLTQWHDEQEVAQGLLDVRQTQEKVNQETTQLGMQTVTKSLQDLKPQEIADLAKQAERQNHGAEQVEQLQRRIGEIVKKLQPEHQEAAERLEQVLTQLQSKNTTGKMRDAAKQVANNEIGQATQTQQQITKDLKELEEALKNQPTSDLESLVKQMKEAEADLERLFEDQEELVKKTTEAQELADQNQREKTLEQLGKEQAELQQRAEQISRKLERMREQGPRDAVQRAVQRMQEAVERLQKEDDDSEEEQQEALDDLQQAQRELAQHRQQVEENLAFEQLEKVSHQIRSLTDRQRAVLEDTKRLAETHAIRGNWTRGQLKSLRDLAEVQRGLKTETESLTDNLSAAKVFALAVKGAARNMQLAATKLDEKNAGEETQRLENSALQRFLNLIDAMKEEKSNKNPDETQPNPQGPGENPPGNQPQGPPQDTVALLSQLKMLRSLQLDLNVRLETLAEKRDRGEPLAQLELDELQQLGTEQGQLAELVTEFVDKFEQQQPSTEGVPVDGNAEPQADE